MPSQTQHSVLQTQPPDGIRTHRTKSRFQDCQVLLPAPQRHQTHLVPYRESGSLSLNRSNHKNADATGFVTDWLVPILNLAEK
jgi:hypothetical protein